MNIIFLTGLTASGKTTIAHTLGRQLNMPTVSLHEILHACAVRNGFERTRYWITSVGIPVMLEEGREALAKAIAEQENERGIIVDDLIDPKTPFFLRGQFPDANVLVARVKVNYHFRKHLIEKRMGIPSKEASEELRFLDRVKREAGIANAIRAADIEIKNSGRIEVVVTKLQEELETRLWPQRPGAERR